MSQFSYSISDEAGAAFLADVNSALQANASMNSGAAAPGTTYGNLLWVDTTNNLVKKRNNANAAWVTFADKDFQHWLLDDGTVGAPSWSFNLDTDTGRYRIGANNMADVCGGAKVLDISAAGLGVTGTLIVSGAQTGAAAAFAGLVIAGGSVSQTTPAGDQFRVHSGGNENIGLGTGSTAGNVRLQAYNDTAGANIKLELQASNYYFISVPTTGSAANAVINTGSTPGGELLRSTSSRRYKKAIRPITDAEVDAGMQLSPITYLSTAAADDPRRRHLGFVAEDAQRKQKMLVQYGRDQRGRPVPDGFQYDRMTVIHHHAINRLAARVEALARGRA